MLALPILTPASGGLPVQHSHEAFALPANRAVAALMIGLPHDRVVVAAVEILAPLGTQVGDHDFSVVRYRQ